MPILILDYTKIKDKRNHNIRYSLCKCDGCGQERIVIKFNALKGYYNCRACGVKKSAKSRTGKKRTPEQRKYMSERRKGKHHWSLEERKEISRRGKQYFKEHPMPTGPACHCYGAKNNFYGKRGKDHPGHKSHFSPEQLEQRYAKLRGPLNGNWNPNLTDEERAKKHRPHTENTNWRRRIFERDDFTCQITGERGGKLRAHHLYNYAEHPALRYVDSNGVTASEDLHRLFHRIYGIKNNTPAQFEQFRQSIALSYC